MRRLRVCLVKCGSYSWAVLHLVHTHLVCTCQPGLECRNKSTCCTLQHDAFQDTQDARNARSGRSGRNKNTPCRFRGWEAPPLVPVACRGSIYLFPEWEAGKHDPPRFFDPKRVLLRGYRFALGVSPSWRSVPLPLLSHTVTLSPCVSAQPATLPTMVPKWER